MLPPPRTNASANWVDLIVKTAIVCGLGWFLVSNMLTLNRTIGLPPEVQAADRALKGNKVAEARAQLDKFIKANAKSPFAYRVVIEFWGANKRGDLLDVYAQQAEQECKNASKADLAELYRSLAAAYLECGSLYAAPALRTAQQAYDLEPDNMDSMNGLAYTLADTTTDPAKLDRAQSLILNALNQLNSQANVSNRQGLLILYEDTYGWVLYKKGVYGPKAEADRNFARAVDLLIDAVAAVPEGVPQSMLNPVYYHLGAAFVKVGRPEDARNMLAVVLQYDPNNEAAKKEMQSLPLSPATPPHEAPAAPPVKTQTSPDPTVQPAFTPLLPTPAHAAKK